MDDDIDGDGDVGLMSFDDEVTEVVTAGILFITTVDALSAVVVEAVEVVAGTFSP